MWAGAYVESMSQQPGGGPSDDLGVLARAFIQALAEAEDAADVADADAAWAEGGEPIPLEELQAEFGVA